MIFIEFEKWIHRKKERNEYLKKCIQTIYIFNFRTILFAFHYTYTLGTNKNDLYVLYVIEWLFSFRG